MNEKILEKLKEKSYIQEVEYYEYHDSAAYYVNVFSEEKFAELIIKECIEIVNHNSQGSERTDDGRVFYYSSDVSEQIKQHFGLKE